MSDDRFDTKIQALMVELIDSTPPAPTWESIQARLDEARPATDPGVTVLPDDGPATARPTADADTVELTDLPAYTKHVERRRPRWRPIAAAGGAVAIVVGGSFAYASFIGEDGAASPEAAVQEFVDSLADEDAVGVFESLPPSERALVTDTMTDLSAEAARLGLTEGLDLSDVDGFDFEVSGLTLEPETLGEGVVAVHLDGTLVSQTTGAELPLGSTVLDSLGDSSALSDFEATVGDLQRVFADEDVFVVAIEEDGGWHVSTWYTIAEYIRRAQDQPLPTFGGTVVPPVGASSPDQAVQGFIQAALGGDLQGALQLALPGESRVLYDYGPLFLDEARQSSTDTPREVTINSLDLVDSGEGDTRTVSLRGYDYTYSDSYSTQRQAFDGDCFTFETDFTDEEPDEGTSCRADAIAEDTLPVEWDMSVGADYVVVQRDGRWYISPVRSVATTVLNGARAVPDAATARQAIDRSGLWLLFPGRLFNLMGGYGGMLASASGSGYSCYTEVAEDGTETEVCEDIVTTTYDETGIPVDEDGNPLPEAEMTATTVMMTASTMLEATPSTMHDATATVPVNDSVVPPVSPTDQP